jgi:hypothetical protein
MTLALKGSPSWNLTPLRSLKVQVRPSAEVSHDVGQLAVEGLVGVLHHHAVEDQVVGDVELGGLDRVVGGEAVLARVDHEHRVLGPGRHRRRQRAGGHHRHRPAVHRRLQESHRRFLQGGAPPGAWIRAHAQRMPGAQKA